jgi:transcriptional regulator with XRE-family HTH domain
MDVHRAIRQRLFYLCRQRHMTIASLSAHAQVPASTIKNVLYGRSQNPGVGTLQQLCNGLDISLFDFFDSAEFRRDERKPAG